MQAAGADVVCFPIHYLKKKKISGLFSIACLLLQQPRFALCKGQRKISLFTFRWDYQAIPINNVTVR